MPTFKWPDGVRLRYADQGGGRPALLFVHGWCGRLEHWSPQVRAFARRQRVIRLDLPGHGRSEAPPGPYTPAEFASDVAALVRHLRLRDAVLVGHSMGSRSPSATCGRRARC